MIKSKFMYISIAGTLASALLYPSLAMAADTPGSVTPLTMPNKATGIKPMPPVRGSVHEGVEAARGSTKEAMDAAKGSAKEAMDAARGSAKGAMDAAKAATKAAMDAAKKAAIDANKVIMDKFKADMAAYKAAMDARKIQIDKIRTDNKPAYDKIKADYKTALAAATTPEAKTAAKTARDAAFAALSATVKAAMDALVLPSKPLAPAHK